MCDGTKLKLAGGGLGTAAALQAGGANAGASEFNQSVLRAQAQQALLIGRERSQRVLSEGHRIEGEQQVAAGSGNVQVGQGTALKLQEDTAVAAGKDAAEEYRSGVLQRWGYLKQAELERYQSRNETNASYYDAATSFVGMFG